MILFCYGTRPEFIKIKPLIDKFIENSIKFKTLFTGQHLDIIDKKYKPDYKIKIPNLNNRLDSILSSGINLKDEFFNGIDYVLIQGDTTSALSMSLFSFHRKIKTIYLEAGLRTYDFENPFPEEMNRQLISRISDINLCPTKLNKNNLENENVKGKNFVVGNTVLDNLVKYKDKCEYGNKVLITLHRRENHKNIEKWFEVLSDIAKNNSDLEFILPIHPNPNVKKYKNLLKNVKVIEPLNHEKLLELLIKCKFVITDSGGIQEECSFLNKKVIVCRKITERPESIGIHSFMCDDPDKLYNLVDEIKKDFEVNKDCPYGNGNSSERILEIFKKEEIT